MKLTEITYQRPDIKAIEQNIKSLCRKFEDAESCDAQLKIIQQINTLRIEFETACSLAYLRHDLNTFDEFYEMEVAFFNENWPIFGTWMLAYSRLLLKSPFREELEEKLGKRLFQIHQFFIEKDSEKTESIDQQLNKLHSEYNKLASQGMLTFRGKEYPLQALSIFKEDLDRATRKEAKDVYFAFWAAQEQRVNRLFDEMLKLRYQKAEIMGFENFVEQSYHQADYTGQQVSSFNQAVLKYFVPIKRKLHKRKLKRLGAEATTYYDALQFKNGNPHPQVSFEEMMANMQKMYAELSPETDEFCRFMLENELLDLEVRKGKYPGGYMTSIGAHSLPFILANFNGTAFDFDVLTHEMGHAFQYYQTRKNGIDQIEYLYASPDACEIHSMAMELFTWKWYALFFKEQTPKFQFNKIQGQINTILSCASCEDFQQYLYLNPSHSHEERNQKWAEVNAEYFPNTSNEAYFDGNKYLQEGRDWLDIAHIITMPFYMIDYALATICALQFWVKAQKDWEGAWRDYLRLCNAGGTRSFTELLQLANLKSPFEESTLKDIADFLSNWLAGVEDSEF